jgi:hypothetical protein
MPADLTPDEALDLDLLRWVQTHAPERMTAESWGHLNRMEQSVTKIRQAREAAIHRRWAPTLTPKRVRELERLSMSGDGMTKDEAQAWGTAVVLSQPPSSRARDWKRWYRTPVAVTLFPDSRREARVSRRSTGGRRLRRAARRGRARSPSRPSEPAALDTRGGAT